MPHRARLIIAEDEKIIALGMKLFLTEAGYEVCAMAKTGPEAVRLAEEFHPDLALLDVRLAQGTDGVTAAREIKTRLGIESILVTGHLELAEARKAGALGLLRKPFEPRRLAQMIEAALHWLRDGVADQPMPAGLLLPQAADLRRRAY